MDWKHVLEKLFENNEDHHFMKWGKASHYFFSNIWGFFISGLCIHCLACFCFALYSAKICAHASTGGFVLPGDYAGTKSTLTGNGRESCFQLPSGNRHYLALKVLKYM